VKIVVEEAAWLSYSAAQKYSGIERTKLWKLLSSGSIEGPKIGCSVHISRRSLEEYMRRNSYVDSKKQTGRPHDKATRK
jgi:excisionase family DNA binding protein